MGVKRAVVTVGLIVALGGARASAQGTSAGEAIEASGIVAHGELVLLTSVYACGGDMPMPTAQIFVSHDEGKTWVKQGPAIDRGGFEFTNVDADGVWVAGRLSATGPKVDPFILIPAAAFPAGGAGTSPPPLWTLTTISVGPAELQGLGRQGTGDLLAWIRHPDAHVEHTWGPVVLHRSNDQGRSWSEAAGAAPKKPAGPVKKFDKLSKQSGDWRINKRRDGGFDVQHKVGKAWQTVKEFPWQQCDGPPDTSVPPLPKTIKLDSIGKIGRDPPTATPPPARP